MYLLTVEVTPKLPLHVIDLANQLYSYLFEDGELPDIPSDDLYGVIYALWVVIDLNTIFNPKRQMPLKYIKPFFQQEKSFLDPEVELALAVCSPIYALRLKSKIKHSQFRATEDPLALVSEEEEEGAPLRIKNMSRFSNPVAAIRRIAPLFLSYLTGRRIDSGYPLSDLYPYLSSPYFSLVTGITRDTTKPFRVGKEELLRRLNAFSFPVMKKGRAGCVLAGGFLFMLSNDNLYHDRHSFRSSDVDLFVYGHPDDREEVLREVLDYYKPYPKTYTSSLVNIDVPTRDEYGEYTRRVQVILSPALHPMDVINTFDLSHIQLAYDGDLYTTTASSFFAMYGESIPVIEKIRGSRIRKAALKGVSVVNNKMTLQVDGSQLHTPYVMIEGDIYHRGRLMSSISRIPLVEISEEEFWNRHYYIPFVLSVPYGSLGIEPLPPAGNLVKDVIYVVKAGTHNVDTITNVFNQRRAIISDIDIRFVIEGLSFDYSEDNWRFTEVTPLSFVRDDEDLLILIDRYDNGKVIGSVLGGSV